MKLLLCVLFALFSVHLAAQQDSAAAAASTEVTTHVYTPLFKESTGKLRDFLESNSINILQENRDDEFLFVRFSVPESGLGKINSFLPLLGYIASNKKNTINLAKQVSEIQLEIKYLKDKLESYRQMLAKMDDKNERYATVWDESKKIEDRLFTREKDLIASSTAGGVAMVSITIHDEATNPRNTDVAFVNMPGVEYAYLKTENPGQGISASSYNGYFVKYLFTKGKSYISLGVFKATGIPAADSTTYTEMFVYGFGQDFYSRHFGRGTNEYFNLYSGYLVGGVNATGRVSKNDVFFIEPSIGCELVKKNLWLLDAKVCYFLPFFPNNRNTRGIVGRVSFNFMF